MTSTPDAPTMQHEHYPGLFQVANAASGKAQRMHLRLQATYLWLLIAGSAVSALSPFVPDVAQKWVYAAMAVILAVGLLFMWVSRSRQDDKAWFDCRAIAESAKTVTWRYMMKASPFKDEAALNESFISVLREIRQARPDCQKHFASVTVAGTIAITDFMRQTRALPPGERKKFYVEQRLRDQKSWYLDRAELNASLGARWFWATTGLQCVAVTLAIVQATSGGLGFSPVPVFTTCAAAAIAWSQMKRHDELGKSYALAAQELCELEAIATNGGPESDFPQLVDQAEEAISREHTMWCSRRDTVIRNSVLK